MATKAELEQRVAELESQLADAPDAPDAADGGPWVSPSGRTSVTVSGDDKGAVRIDVRRDGRQAHRFELNRELEIDKEE